jgi:uncharacterized protein with FMN-binding domain
MKYILGLTLLVFTIAGFTLASMLFLNCAGFSRGSRVQEEPEAAETEAAEEREGTGQGYRGTIRVRLRMEAGAIAEIEIVDSAEDRAVGGAAIEELVELVLTYNSTDIDAISGATETSEGFLEAVENAILGL